MTDQGPYNAGTVSVSTVTTQGFTLSVNFSTGGDGFAPYAPDQGCVIISSGPSLTPTTYYVDPIHVDIASQVQATNQIGEIGSNYAGTLVFPMIISGSYSFEWGCTNLYPLISLGTATAGPLVAVSNYTAETGSPIQYFAAVYEVRTSSEQTVVLYAATGPSDLDSPVQSCIVAGQSGAQDSSGAAPTVTNVFATSSTSTDQAEYVGVMSFGGRPTPGSSFEYGCNSGYETVAI